MVRLTIIVQMLWAFCAVTVANADSRAVILPPRLETGVPEEVGDKVAEYVAMHLRDARNMQVTPPVTAHEGVPEASQECWTTSCALQYRATFNADFAVVIAMFAQHGVFTSFNVVIVVDEGAEYSAGENITAATNLEQAAVRALQSALRKRDHGPGPWLTVLADSSNAADEATIEIDGRVAGKIPYVDRISAGDHYVMVRKEGYQSLRKVVAIAPGAGSEEELMIKLQPLGAARKLSARERRGAADWVVGGVLVAIGGAYAGTGLYGMARDGDCAAHSTVDGVTGCTARYSAGGGAWTQLIGGAVAMLGGASIIGWAPIGALLQTDRRGTTASLTYSGEF